MWPRVDKVRGHVNVTVGVVMSTRLFFFKDEYAVRRRKVELLCP